MAKRNMDELLKDYRGQVIRVPNPLITPMQEEDLSLRLACMVACWTTAADGSDNSLPMKDKMDLFHLGERCSEGGIVDFKAAEITKLQERISKIFVSIQTIGIANGMLETEPEVVHERAA